MHRAVDEPRRLDVSFPTSYETRCNVKWCYGFRALLKRKREFHLSPPPWIKTWARRNRIRFFPFTFTWFSKYRFLEILSKFWNLFRQQGGSIPSPILRTRSLSNEREKEKGIDDKKKKKKRHLESRRVLFTAWSAVNLSFVAYKKIAKRRIEREAVVQRGNA